MSKFKKNLSLFKSARLIFESQETPPEPQAEPQPETPAEPPATPELEYAKLTAAQERARTTKDILDGAKADRAAVSTVQETALTVDPENKLLKQDTYILISQRGTGSKHNARGWKGLALTTDSVKILSRQVKLINGLEMVKVKLTHKLYTKPGAKEKFRTYIGYIPKKSFDPSVRLRAPEPENPHRRWRERPEESKPKTEGKALEPQAEMRRINARFKRLFARYPIPNDLKVIPQPQVDPTGKWVIHYGKSDSIPGQNDLITVVIDHTKSPYEYTVNGNPAKDESAAVAMAEGILKQSVPPKPTESSVEGLPRDYIASSEELKARETYSKFVKLFKRYPVTNGTISNSFKGTGGLDDKTYTIEYGINDDTKNNEYQTLVKIDIDASKETLVFTINGQSTKNLDDALSMAERILQEKTTKQPKEPESKDKPSTPKKRPNSEQEIRRPREEINGETDAHIEEIHKVKNIFHKFFPLTEKYSASHDTGIRYKDSPSIGEPRPDFDTHLYTFEILSNAFRNTDKAKVEISITVDISQQKPFYTITAGKKRLNTNNFNEAYKFADQAILEIQLPPEEKTDQSTGKTPIATEPQPAAEPMTNPEPSQTEAKPQPAAEPATNPEPSPTEDEKNFENPVKFEANLNQILKPLYPNASVTFTDDNKNNTFLFNITTGGKTNKPLARIKIYYALNQDRITIIDSKTNHDIVHDSANADYSLGLLRAFLTKSKLYENFPTAKSITNSFEVFGKNTNLYVGPPEFKNGKTIIIHFYQRTKAEGIDADKNSAKVTISFSKGKTKFEIAKGTPQKNNAPHIFTTIAQKDNIIAALEELGEIFQEEPKHQP